MQVISRNPQAPLARFGFCCYIRKTLRDVAADCESAGSRKTDDPGHGVIFESNLLKKANALPKG